MSDGASLDPYVRTYYDEGREQSRLQTSSRLELIRTQELLHRVLPRPPAMILDIGGGAGAHALPLLAAGYEVALVDPVPLHVEQARSAGVEQATLGDARALPYEDATFDAALLFGPLYHLPERGDRVRALREAARVVRSGGVVCAAVISRFASTFDGLFAGFLTDPRFEQIVAHDLVSGRHENPIRSRVGSPPPTSTIPTRSARSSTTRVVRRWTSSPSRARRRASRTSAGG